MVVLENDAMDMKLMGVSLSSSSSSLYCVALAGDEVSMSPSTSENDQALRRGEGVWMIKDGGEKTDVTSDSASSPNETRKSLVSRCMCRQVVWMPT